MVWQKRERLVPPDVALAPPDVDVVVLVVEVVVAVGVVTAEAPPLVFVAVVAVAVDAELEEELEPVVEVLLEPWLPNADPVVSVSVSSESVRESSVEVSSLLLAASPLAALTDGVVAGSRSVISLPPQETSPSVVIGTRATVTRIDLKLTTDIVDSLATELKLLIDWTLECDVHMSCSR